MYSNMEFSVGFMGEVQEVVMDLSQLHHRVTERMQFLPFTLFPECSVVLPFPTFLNGIILTVNLSWLNAVWHDCHPF